MSSIATGYEPEWVFYQHEPFDAELAHGLHWLINREWGKLRVLPDSPVLRSEWVPWLLDQCWAWSLWQEHSFRGYFILEKPGEDDTLHVGMVRQTPRAVRDAVWKCFISQSALQFRVLHSYLTVDRPALRKAAEKRGWTFEPEPGGRRWHGRFQEHAEVGRR